MFMATFLHYYYAVSISHSSTRILSLLLCSLRIKYNKTTQKNIEEPMVPKLSPPALSGFVSKSPNVAPKGLVKTNATQNRNTEDIFVKKYMRAVRINNPQIIIAPPANPSPVESAR